MPPRTTPTAREARLGTELRRLRERAGRSAREAAEAIGTDRSKISHIESGHRGISAQRIRRLAGLYGCADGALIDALCAIAHERRGGQWWEEYRAVLAPGFLDVAEMEHHATWIQSVQMLTVPGVLQTEQYARAVFGSGMPAEQLDSHVEHRMKRSRILDDGSLQYFAVVHEAALRMRYGGRKVARAQLERLLEQADRPNLTLRVIPFAFEGITGHAQSVQYAAGQVPQLDTVQIDSPFGGAFLDAEEELVKYRRLIDTLEQAALGGQASKQVIHSVAKEM